MPLRQPGNGTPGVNWTSLSSELIQEVCTSLDNYSLAHMRCVCTHWCTGVSSFVRSLAIALPNCPGGCDDCSRLHLTGHLGDGLHHPTGWDRLLASRVPPQSRLRKHHRSNSSESFTTSSSCMQQSQSSELVSPSHATTPSVLQHPILVHSCAPSASPGVHAAANNAHLHSQYHAAQPAGRTSHPRQLATAAASHQHATNRGNPDMHGSSRGNSNASSGLQAADGSIRAPHHHLAALCPMHTAAHLPASQQDRQQRSDVVGTPDAARLAHKVRRAFPAATHMTVYLSLAPSHATGPELRVGTSGPTPPAGDVMTMITPNTVQCSMPGGQAAAGHTTPSRSTRAGINAVAKQQQQRPLGTSGSGRQQFGAVSQHDALAPARAGLGYPHEFIGAPASSSKCEPALADGGHNHDAGPGIVQALKVLMHADLVTLNLVGDVPLALLDKPSGSNGHATTGLHRGPCSKQACELETESNVSGSTPVHQLLTRHAQGAQHTQQGSRAVCPGLQQMGSNAGNSSSRLVASGLEHDGQLQLQATRLHTGSLPKCGISSDPHLSCGRSGFALGRSGEHHEQEVGDGSGEGGGKGGGSNGEGSGQGSAQCNAKHAENSDEGSQGKSDQGSKAGSRGNGDSTENAGDATQAGITCLEETAEGLQATQAVYCPVEDSSIVPAAGTTQERVSLNANDSSSNGEQGSRANGNSGQVGASVGVGFPLQHAKPQPARQTEDSGGSGHTELQQQKASSEDLRGGTIPGGCTAASGTAEGKGGSDSAFNAAQSARAGAAPSKNVRSQVISIRSQGVLEGSSASGGSTADAATFHHSKAANGAGDSQALTSPAGGSRALTSAGGSRGLTSAGGAGTGDGDAGYGVAIHKLHAHDEQPSSAARVHDGHAPSACMHQPQAVAITIPVPQTQLCRHGTCADIHSTTPVLQDVIRADVDHTSPAHPATQVLPSTVEHVSWVGLVSQLRALKELRLLGYTQLPPPSALAPLQQLPHLQLLDIRLSIQPAVQVGASNPLSVLPPTAAFPQQSALLPHAATGAAPTQAHITDAHLEHLSRLSSLTALHLNCVAGVSGHGLSHLRALTCLRQLTLCDALDARSVTALDIEALLSALPKLQHLSLGRATPTCPLPLALLPAGHAAVLPAGAPGLALAPGMQMGMSMPPSWGTTVLTQAKRLRFLGMQFVHSLDDQLLQGVGQLSGLKVLDLEALDLSYGEMMGFLTTCTRLHALRHLALGACVLFDTHLAAIAQLTQLQQLTLEQVDVRTRDISGWTCLAPLTRLTRFEFQEWNNPILSVGNLAVLTDESVTMMATHWPNLARLRYLGKVLLTSHAQGALASLPCLSHLCIIGPEGTRCMGTRGSSAGMSAAAGAATVRVHAPAAGRTAAAIPTAGRLPAAAIVQSNVASTSKATITATFPSTRKATFSSAATFPSTRKATFPAGPVQPVDPVHAGDGVGERGAVTAADAGQPAVPSPAGCQLPEQHSTQAAQQLLSVGHRFAHEQQPNKCNKHARNTMVSVEAGIEVIQGSSLLARQRRDTSEGLHACLGHVAMQKGRTPTLIAAEAARHSPTLPALTANAHMAQPSPEPPCSPPARLPHTGTVTAAGLNAQCPTAADYGELRPASVRLQPRRRFASGPHQQMGLGDPLVSAEQASHLPGDVYDAEQLLSDSQRTPQRAGGAGLSGTGGMSRGVKRSAVTALEPGEAGAGGLQVQLLLPCTRLSSCNGYITHSGTPSLNGSQGSEESVNWGGNTDVEDMDVESGRIGDN